MKFKDLLDKLKRFSARILSYLPTSLPVGMTEFDKWSDSVIALSPLPNNSSSKFTVAVMIPHLDSTTARKPKAYFVRALHKAAANQIAYSIIQELKAKQAEQEKTAAATAQNVAPVDDIKQQEV